MPTTFRASEPRQDRYDADYGALERRLNSLQGDIASLRRSLQANTGGNRVIVPSAGGGGGGGGSASLVTITVPDILTVNNGQQASGTTFALALASQVANTFFGGPTAGGSAVPVFRSLVAADLPPSGVVPGSYTNADLTVDIAGRIVAVSNGAGGTGTASFGSVNPNLIFGGPSVGPAAFPDFRPLTATDLPTVSGLTPGSYTSINATIDQYGRVVTVASGAGGGGGGGGYPPWTAPPTSGWSWVNQGSSTSSSGTALDGSPYVAIRVPSSSSFAGGRFYLRNLPAAPYTLTFVLQAFTQSSTNFEWGVALREAGVGIISFGLRSYGSGDWRVTRQGYSSAGTGTSGGATNSLSLGAIGGGVNYGTLFFLRLVDDGTNRKFLISSDGGEWFEAFSESNTLGISPIQFGLYVTPWSGPNFTMNESIVTLKHLSGI